MERARLTHKLAKMKELEGDITEAANIMQELQVETYGSMNKREKVHIKILIVCRKRKMPHDFFFLLV